MNVFNFLNLGAKRPATVVPRRGSEAVTTCTKEEDGNPDFNTPDVYSTDPTSPANSVASSSTLATLLSSMPRQVRMEGWLTKEGEVFKSWHDRFFILDQTTLTYFNDEGQLKGLVNLRGAIIRRSCRKDHGLETRGFEIVVNPSPTTRDGGVVYIVGGGEGGSKEWAGTRSSTPSMGESTNGNASVNSTSSTSSTSTPPASSPSTGSGGSAQNAPNGERIYYLCVPENASTPNDTSAVIRDRNRWMAALQNNIDHSRRLHAWLSEVIDAQNEQIAAARNQVDEIRAQREMERIEREDKERKERREREQREEEERKRRVEEDAASASSKGHKKNRSSLYSQPAPSPESLMGASYLDSISPISSVRDLTLLQSSSDAFSSADSTSLSDTGTTNSDEGLVSCGSKNVNDFISALRNKNARIQTELRRVVQEKEALEKEKDQLVRSQVEKEIEKAVESFRQQIRIQERALEQARKEAQEARMEAQTAKSSAVATTSDTAGKDGAPSTTSSPPPEFISLPSSPPPSQSSSLDASTSHSFQPSPESSCACSCTPPCVPFPAHRSALARVMALEGELREVQAKLSKLTQENETYEAAATKLKMEKKLLKNEVIRLRNAMAQAQ